MQAGAGCEVNIFPQLPNLTKEKTLLKKIPGLLYFDLKQDDNSGELPSNATTLVKDGTIEVLEVEDDTDAGLCYEEGTAKLVEMKIQGIEEIVNLKFARHGGKHGWHLNVSIKIGGKEYLYIHVHCNRDRTYTAPDDSRTSEVLKQLHEVLGIPKHQTAQMIHLLFYPYCDFAWIDEIEPVEEEPR